jgi:hypothetical protein
MNFRKIAAVAASATALGALALGTSTPADAQAWHHGYAPGYRHFHGTVSPHYVGPIYHHGPRYFHRRPVVTYWTPGPGYVRHSWAWYNSQPGYWRAAHPYRYHGSPSLGVWIRL